MAEQRQRARGVAELGGDRLGKAALDLETAPLRRFLDSTHDVGGTHRPEEDLAVGEALGEVRQCRELAVEVRPHGDDRTCGMGKHGSGEVGALGRIVSQRHELLELVDDEHVAWMLGKAGALECVERAGTRSHDDRLGERRHQAGEDQRRLAAAGRADDRDEAALGEQPAATLDERLTPHEQIGLVRGERSQARIWSTRRVGWRRHAVRNHGDHLVGRADHLVVVRTEENEADRRRQSLAHDISGRRREQDLARPGQLTHPCGSEDHRSPDLAVRQHELPRRDPHPHSERPAVVTERALQLDRRPNRVDRVGEQRRRGAALHHPAEPAAGMGLHAAVHHELHRGEQRQRIGGERSHSASGASTAVSTTVTTPAGVESSQPARSRSTSAPGDGGRRSGSIASPALTAASTRAATSRSTPTHAGAPPVGGSPVRSVTTVAASPYTSLASVGMPPPATSGARKPGVPPLWAGATGHRR